MEHLPAAAPRQAPPRPDHRVRRPCSHRHHGLPVRRGHPQPGPFHLAGRCAVTVRGRHHAARAHPAQHLLVPHQRLCLQMARHQELPAVRLRPHWPDLRHLRLHPRHHQTELSRRDVTGRAHLLKRGCCIIFNRTQTDYIN
ncbi:hypothetical protein FOCC_FOCC009378 [Frankliniella occidentalis]|nr:hypothetical protein FOCC_FOCC009378 [Frankliniella occidentalis]